MVATHRCRCTRFDVLSLILILGAEPVACVEGEPPEEDAPRMEEIVKARETYCEAYSSCTFVPPGPPSNQTYEVCLMTEEEGDATTSLSAACANAQIDLRECLAAAGCDGIYLYKKVSPERPCAEEGEAFSRCGDI